MTPEEYNKLKEAEKEHLRALKKLKETKRQAERKGAVLQALKNLTTGTEDALGTHDEMVRKLELDAIQHEARLDMALENIPDEPSEDASSVEALEEEMRALRAQELIRQMKIQMGGPASEPSVGAPSSSPSEEAKAAPASSSKEPDDAPRPPESPQKTIGRMR